MHIDVTPIFTDKTKRREVFCVKFSPDNEVIASSYNDGKVKFLNSEDGSLIRELVVSDEKFPITSIRYNPILPNSFVISTSNGYIKEWNSEDLQNVWTTSEHQNEIYSIDIQKDGVNLVTGGLDTVVKIYDLKTKQLKSEFKRAKYDHSSPSGHSDRVYCVLFSASDTNMFFSGGWDNTIQVWDIRSSIASMVLPGPHVCGDSLDQNDSYLISGSWSSRDQLSLWDLRKGTTVNTVTWNKSMNTEQCHVYTVKFLPNGRNFVAGGSVLNQIRLYDTNTLTILGSSLTFNSSIFSSTISKDGKSVCVGTSNGYVSLHRLAQ